MACLLDRVPWMGAVAIAASVLALSPAAAAAQECASDGDCGEGYVCETHEYGSCSAPACMRGEDCSDVEPTCETHEYRACGPARCGSDGDCPEPMVCHAQRYLVCTGGMGVAGSGAACAPDEMCTEPPPIEEPTCWEEAGDSVCTPRYQLPCTVASDCGAGFDCVESRYVICSGGGMAGAGAPAGGAEADPPPADDPAVERDAGAAMMLPPDYECHEETTGQFHCQLQDLPCSADADCPSGLLCRENYSYPPCVGAAGTGAGGAAGSASSADGGMDRGDFACPEPVLEQRCMPRDYYGGMGPLPTPPGSGGATGGSDDGGGSDAGVASDPGEESMGSAGTGAEGPGAPSMGGGGEGGDEADDGRPRRGLGWLLRGCSASGPVEADLGWIALGMVAIALRRRARRVG